MWGRLLTNAATNSVFLSPSLGADLASPNSISTAFWKGRRWRPSGLSRLARRWTLIFSPCSARSTPQISAYLAAVALDGGDANNNIGDSGLAAQLTAEQTKVENLNGTIKLLKEQIDSLNAQIIRLDSNLKDKDAIIELLKERRQNM